MQCSRRANIAIWLGAEPMNIKWLRAFQAVVITKSVTQASARLHLTQSAVSRMISALEADLGFALFARERGRLAITPQGEAFYLDVEQALAGVDNIERVGKSIRAGEGTLLRLFSMSSFVDDLLPAAVAAFSQEYETVRLSLDIRGGREFIYWDTGRRFDLGLVLLPGDRVAAGTRVFAEVPLFVVMPADHRLSQELSVDLADVAQEKLIMLPPTSLLRRWIDGKFAEARRSPSVRIEASSMYAACRYVDKGFGITLADPFAIHGVRSRNLAIRPLKDELKASCCFVLRSDREPPAMVTRFMELTEGAAIALLDEINRGIKQVAPGKRRGRNAGSRKSVRRRRTRRRS